VDHATIFIQIAYVYANDFSGGVYILNYLIGYRVVGVRIVRHENDGVGNVIIDV
jgi:hypothetical protein